MKKSKIGLGIWALILGSCLLFAPLSVKAEDVTLTLPIEDAKRLVVELEKVKIYATQIELLEKANLQLIEQTIILNNQVELLKEQVQLKQEQLDLTVKEMDDMKKVYEAKIDAYEKEKPTIMEKVGLSMGSAGIGALLMLLLL